MYDTNIASLTVKSDLPPLPLVTRNVKDFAAVAEHHGPMLIAA